MGEEKSGAGKSLLSSALLVASVAAIMIAGMVLRTTGRSEPAAPAQETPKAPQSLPLGSEITPDVEPATPKLAIAEEPPPVIRDTAPEPPASPLLVSLATRAEADCGRLAKAKGPWTAQLLVACKPETVERVLAAAGGSSKLYVLPARVKDDACFRVCFGDYPQPALAAAAVDLPPALRGKEKIGAAEIAKVLP